MDMIEDLSGLLDDSNNIIWANNDGFSTATICSTMQMGGQVEETVRREIHTFTPALVESVKREMQASMPPLVEEAVLKGIQASTPMLVEEVLHKGMQVLMPIMLVMSVISFLRGDRQWIRFQQVEEMRKMFSSTFLPMLQSPAQLSNSSLLAQKEDSHASRALQLHFELEPQSEPLEKIYTQKSLRDQGVSLKVVLKDHFGNIVGVGAESSIKIKIVVLNGDFPEKDRDDVTGISPSRFRENILSQRENKPPLLTGKYELALREGVANADEITFTDNSSWMKRKKFRLGVEVAKRVSRGVVIREAISEPFEVKEIRGESYQKKKTPALNDEVWRLCNIAKGGQYHTRLEKAEINSVNDLLELHHKNPKSLKEILQVPDKKYTAIITHAKSAHTISRSPGPGFYSYEGKDSIPLDYDFPDELSKICGLNHHRSSFPFDNYFIANGSSANILPDVAAANPAKPYCTADSEMLQRTTSEPNDPFQMFSDTPPENLYLTADTMYRVQEIENDLRACTSKTQPSTGGLNKPRWRRVGAALRFSVFRIVINRQACRARKKQRYY